MKKKIIIISLSIILIISLVISSVISTSKLTDFEVVLLNNETERKLNYLDNYENTKKKNIENYILYAMEYAKYELGKNELSMEELLNHLKRILMLNSL